jgi:hypothetical protein
MNEDLRWMGLLGACVAAACGDSSGSGGAAGGADGAGGTGDEPCPYAVNLGDPMAPCPCNTFAGSLNSVCTVDDCAADPSICPNGTGCAEGLDLTICLAPCDAGACAEGLECADEQSLFAGFCRPL